MSDDRGFSIMELLVAIMVFAVIAVGIAYSLASTLRLTQDSRSREVAIHLASQEIDSIRALENIFDVVASSTDLTVDGITYTIIRTPVWDNSVGDAMQCGDLSSGSGSFEFKRVQIEVTWSGQRAGSSPVYSDTIVSPNRRITDPALGTLLISVLDSQGIGNAGISVTATPLGGGATVPPETPPSTDSEGCSYVLKVTPGEYRLTVSKSGYVDVDQNLDTSSSTITVGAGELKSVQFQFDEAARYELDLAPDYAGSFVLPDNLPVTAFNSYGTFNLTLAGNIARLHPFLSGYEFVTGTYIPSGELTAGCLSPDPTQWPERGDGAVGARSDLVAAPAGASVTAPVGMGIVQISTNNQRQIRAVSVASNPYIDDPGCDEGYTLYFPNQNGTADLALPYGSWELQQRCRTCTGSWSAMGTVSTHKLVGVLTQGQIDDHYLVSLDPRELP